MLAVPDLASHTLAPWQPELAELKCGISVDAPRLILKGAPEKARQRGVAHDVGCAAEYFLARRTPGRGIEVADSLDRRRRPAATPRARPGCSTT